MSNAAYRKTHPIWTSLSNHAYKIRKRHSAYREIPFYPKWNPRQGGSFMQGEKDLLKEIGVRPGLHYDLHIITRTIGVWPGNLMWLPRKQHKREELISKLLIENQRLKVKFTKATKMKRLCIFYKHSGAYIGRPIEWIVCQECAKKLRKGFSITELFSKPCPRKERNNGEC